uniref:elicitor-responsive protein 1-like n=1 Tax=Erigeron canadensis TaxID=72917 RepID=UPI001CB95F3E|nr:elicitor-responsive protein 1-like [Erigeron canadensis]
MMSIHGSLLEVTVVSCSKLKDTEWLSRQDPYVCVEYGSNRSTTRTCTDGGKNPTFQEKFVYSLVEGLREINVAVWNSNTVTHDDYIGSVRIPLTKALSHGFDDSTWPLQSKTGRHAGEVRLIMHYSNGNKPSKSLAPSYAPHNAPPVPTYSAPPPAAYYPPTPYPSYAPNSGGYPPAPYPPQATTYPPTPYPPNPAYGSHYPHGSPFPGTYPPPPY